MGDSCTKITVVVDIQSNGIIRTIVDGYIIGRIDKDTSMEKIAEQIEESGLRILDAKGTKL